MTYYKILVASLILALWTNIAAFAQMPTVKVIQNIETAKVVSPGPQGPTGATGPTGPTGPPGPTGPTGAPGTPVWEGAWSSSTTYNVGQAVGHSGSSYVANAMSTNQAPPNASYWDLLAGGSATTLPAAYIIVGNSMGLPGQVPMAGDAEIDDTGSVTVLKTQGVAFAASATTNALNAGNLNAGTLSASRMPGLTGDVTSSSGSVSTTLATVNSNVGTFQGIQVNGKGLVTGATNENYLTGNQSITLSGDIAGSGTTSISTTLPTVNSNVGTFQGIQVNAKGQVTGASNQSYLTGNQTITLTGDITGSGSTALSTTLKNTGAGAGSCTSCNETIDAQGRVTAYSNGTAGVSSVSGTSGQITASPTTGAVVVGLASSAAIPGSPTTTTQSPGDNSTKVSTTAYADASSKAAASNAWNAAGPWSDVDFGSQSPAGSHCTLPDGETIVSSGGNDSTGVGHLSYQTISGGDFTLTALVADASSGHYNNGTGAASGISQFATSGLLISSALNLSGHFAYFDISPGANMAAGSDAGSFGSVSTISYPPIWLRLHLASSVLHFYYSFNGQTWIEINSGLSTTNFNGTIYVGLWDTCDTASAAQNLTRYEGASLTQP